MNMLLGKKRPNGYWTKERVLSICKKITKENGGVLPGYTKLKKQGYGSLGLYICKYFKTKDEIRKILNCYGVKICNKCNQKLELGKFRFHRRSGGSYKESTCINCERKIVKEYRSNGAGLAAMIVKSAKIRSKNNNLNFNIDKKYILGLLGKSNGFCQISGIAFKRGGDSGYNSPFSVSLDRIEPKRGYVKGNVRLIINSLNVFKSNRTDKEMFLIMAKTLHEQFKSKSVKSILRELA